MSERIMRPRASMATPTPGRAVTPDAAPARSQPMRRFHPPGWRSPTRPRRSWARRSAAPARRCRSSSRSSAPLVKQVGGNPTNQSSEQLGKTLRKRVREEGEDTATLETIKKAKPTNIRQQLLDVITANKANIAKLDRAVYAAIDADLTEAVELFVNGKMTASLFGKTLTALYDGNPIAAQQFLTRLSEDLAS